jgi:hypothetical protein
MFPIVNGGVGTVVDVRVIGLTIECWPFFLYFFLATFSFSLHQT